MAVLLWLRFHRSAPSTRNLAQHFPLYLVGAVSLPAAAAQRKDESAGEI